MKRALSTSAKLLKSKVMLQRACYSVGTNVKPSNPITLFTTSEKTNTDEIFGNKKVVVVGPPAPFTPICTSQQVPSFIEKVKEIKAKGVDDVVVLSVSDPFVMKAWQDQLKGEELNFVADPKAELTKLVKQDLDMSEAGLGIKSNRYTMVVDDGKVVTFNAEKEAQVYTITDADKILSEL